MPKLTRKFTKSLQTHPKKSQKKLLKLANFSKTASKGLPKQHKCDTTICRTVAPFCPYVDETLRFA